MEKETVGIVVGGGPAPGINGVISSATIEAINHGKNVLGIVGGFSELFAGNRESVMPLTIDLVSRLHTTGGSILRTSRDAPENAQKKFKILMNTLKQLGIKYLITIGGEGTLYMANWIEREGRGEINVVHTPKTIDNDIPIPGGFSTFGFQTARHTGVKIVNNLMEDARTMGRWYFITTMGRHTGHLALGMAKASGATICLIPEEFEEKTVSIRKFVDVLTGSIIKRLCMGRDHGVAVLAEGIAEKCELDSLRDLLDVERDAAGRIRLSELQIERVLKDLVIDNLKSMGLKASIVEKNIGYELRAAPPIPFDIDYTRNLGYGAVRYLLKGGTAAMIVVYEGRIIPVPFVEMVDAKGNIRVRKVDINSEIYEVARNYMIRLEEEDFTGEQLARLAAVAHMSPDAFKERFSYITLRRSDFN
ncbi:MAG: 6-phosphofructokinase [Syntrophobacterales bacterium]|jgi:6-phosphofructokinase 1|nr:6-phosphofructokinase [Syntrophobacterales bacterium]